MPVFSHHSATQITGLAAFALAGLLSALVPVLAQEAPARGARAPRPPVDTPLAEPNMPALIKSLGLVESNLPARQFIKGWHKPKKIVVMLDNNVHRLDWLKEVVPSDVQLVVARSREDLVKEVGDADGALGGCDKAMIAAAGPNFHWTHVNYAGVESCFTGADTPARLKDGTLAVTNSQKITGDTVADHAIALMLALSRGLDQYVRMDVAGKFNTDPYPRLISVRGHTILIAGLGGVGSAMASMAHGLGMRVIATNGHVPPDAPDWIEHIGLPDDLGTLAGQADVVMSALPATPQTNGLFNAAMFAKFKKGAIFINVTRPAVQVDADLAAALDSGQLSAAGVDDPNVTSPLVHAKNIIFTPYVASQNADSELSRGGETTWDVARENLRRYVNGDKLLSVVDPVKGY